MRTSEHRAFLRPPLRISARHKSPYTSERTARYSRNNRAATVKVQRESTTSSTKSTGPLSIALRSMASEPRTLRACWSLLFIVSPFCSGRSAFLTNARRNGSRSDRASRRAKSGTRSGWRHDGIAVTRSGKGSGRHRCNKAAQALTSSSATHWSWYLPRRTRPPQPASPHVQPRPQVHSLLAIPRLVGIADRQCVDDAAAPQRRQRLCQPCQPLRLTGQADVLQSAITRLFAVAVVASRRKSPARWQMRVVNPAVAELRTQGNKARCWSSPGARAAGPHPRRQARFPGDAGQRPALPGLAHAIYAK